MAAATPVRRQALRLVTPCYRPLTRFATTTTPLRRPFNPYPAPHHLLTRPFSLSTSRFNSHEPPVSQPAVSGVHSPSEAKKGQDILDKRDALKGEKPLPHRRPDTPSYQLTFTCKACDERSAHTVSKQGYHQGTVLVQCPGCKNRHLISDHLKIFSDKSVTLEDILAERGHKVQRGSIDMEGDMEFWGDGAPPQGQGAKNNSKS